METSVGKKEKKEEKKNSKQTEKKHKHHMLGDNKAPDSEFVAVEIWIWEREMRKTLK